MDEEGIIHNAIMNIASYGENLNRNTIQDIINGSNDWKQIHKALKIKARLSELLELVRDQALYDYGGRSAGGREVNDKIDEILEDGSNE